jgi:hypothetical protein
LVEDPYLPQRHHKQILVILLTENKGREREKPEVSAVPSRGFESPLPHHEENNASSKYEQPEKSGHGEA